MASHRTTYIEDIIDRAFSSTNVHRTRREGSGRDLRYITSAKLYVVTWANKNTVGSRITILGIGWMLRGRVVTIPKVR